MKERQSPLDRMEERKFEGPLPGAFPYRKLWRNTVFLTALVTLAPLFIVSTMFLFQYSSAIEAEMEQPTVMLLSRSKRSLESFIEERIAALHLVTRLSSGTDLCDAAHLGRTLRHVEQSFGGFKDLGVIRSDGLQCAYAGPYDLEGKDYHRQEWFDEVGIRGEYVSDVFMGYRDVPHFVIAVRSDDVGGDWHVLRATVGAELLREFTVALQRGAPTDSFIINREGVLQTPSLHHGALLEPVDIAIPPFHDESRLIDWENDHGHRFAMGYAYIDRSPFVLVLTTNHQESLARWIAVRGEYIGILLAATVLILTFILWNTTNFVSRLRKADHRRAEYLQIAEHTNKMASIGRLAAGVAHEINNPLAIINEKAGLMGDIIEMTEDFPRRKQALDIVRSITSSVERGSAVTHRLLGFAKRMDMHRESIDMEELLREVLTFLCREAEYRGVVVEFHVQDDLPSVMSDRGQLQQVFLNIINNAMAAVDDAGEIDIWIERKGKDHVVVRIQDDGEGIPRENLQNIFEPFYSTKGEAGTGLGLAITYGIVEKLGGMITVESEVGEGTMFTITLPVGQNDF